MYNSVKKYSDFCILTQIDYNPHQLNVYEKAKRKMSRKENEDIQDKLSNNIIRAKQKIYDLAMVNDFEYFFTGTINGNYDRTDYKSVFRKVSQKFRDIRKVCGSFEYLIIVELHKDLKNYHFHGLLKGNLDNYLYINNNGYLSLSCYDDFGFNSISPIKDINKCSAYITKYITKQLSSKKKGERLYFRSNGLKTPECFGFFGDINFDDWDFQNLYCKKIKLPLDFFDNFV